MWGVTLPQALHPRPGEVQREQRSADVVIFRSGMEVIYSRKRRGMRICHNSDISKDSPACEGVLGVDGEGWTHWCVGHVGTSWIMEVLRDNNVLKTHKTCINPFNNEL